MFQPKFCPNPTCSHHQAINVTGEKWYIFHGVHTSKSLGVVQRFICKKCGKTFSSQTFSQSYYAKIVFDYSKATELLASGLSLRKTAKILGLNHKVVTLRQEMLRQSPSSS